MTSTSDKSNDKRSSMDDNLIQYADEVTQNPLFHFICEIYITKPRRPNEEKQNDKRETRQQKGKCIHEKIEGQEEP